MGQIGLRSAFSGIRWRWCALWAFFDCGGFDAPGGWFASAFTLPFVAPVVGQKAAFAGVVPLGGTTLMT